jgi:ABC-type amino acid transport substrate-binding protein
MLKRLLPALVAILLALPAHAGSVRVAVEDLPPYSKWNGNRPEGPFVVLGWKLTSFLGVSPDFIGCDRDECLKLLETGRADILFGIRPRPELESFLWFPEQPVAPARETAFWTRRGSGTRLERHSDLYGKTVGVMRGLGLAPKFADDPRIERFPQGDMIRLFKLLVAGNIDVVALDAVRGSAALERTGFGKWVERAPYFIQDTVPEHLAVSERSRLSTERDYVEQALEKALGTQENHEAGNVERRP